MSEAETTPSTGQVSVRLRIPGGAPYRELAAALAGKFAEVAGLRRDEVQSLCQAFAHAAEDVVLLEECTEGHLDIMLSRQDANLRMTISCGAHHAELARTLRHAS
jgi:hypothetical protein